MDFAQSDSGLYVPDYKAMLARRRFGPVAKISIPGCDGASLMDRIAIEEAYRLKQRWGRILNAVPFVVDVSGSTVYTANASTMAETTQLTISGTVGGQKSPTIPPNFFGFPGEGISRSFTFEAWGYASVTGTPTLTFTIRMSTTPLAVSGGVILAISPAITASSGISNKPWYLKLDAECSIAGQGTGNASLQCFTEIHMPLAGSATGFAGTTSQMFAATALTAPDQTAWVSTFDPTSQQYLSVNTTWSASSSSNTSLLKKWRLQLNY